MMRLYNKRNGGVPADAVLIDRSTPFGNPFPITPHQNRDLVCDMFDRWLEHPDQAPLVEKAKRDLRGKDLVCWCAPKRCHGETWLRIVNEACIQRE